MTTGTGTRAKHMSKSNIIVETFTREQKRAAFEWLRRVSVSESEDKDHAGCMLWEVIRLGKLVPLLAQAIRVSDQARLALQDCADADAGVTAHDRLGDILPTPTAESAAD